MALASLIDHPRLVLNFDLYHAPIGEGNLLALARECLPWMRWATAIPSVWRPGRRAMTNRRWKPSVPPSPSNLTFRTGDAEQRKLTCGS